MEKSRIVGKNATYSRAYFCVVMDGIYPALQPYYRVDTLASPEPTNTKEAMTKHEQIILWGLTQNEPILDSITNLAYKELYLKARVHRIAYKTRGYQSFWRHNGNNKRYALIRKLTDKTNDVPAVLYEDILTREQYVREAENFYQSFTEIK